MMRVRINLTLDPSVMFRSFHIGLSRVIVVGGGVRGENFKVTKHQVSKSIPGMQLSCAMITLQIFWAKPGNQREGG